MSIQEDAALTFRKSDTDLTVQISRLLKSLEWSSFQRGERMGAADGWMYPACPKCGQIKPGFGIEDFMPAAIGHTRKCPLAKAITVLGGA